MCVICVSQEYVFCCPCLVSFLVVILIDVQFSFCSLISFMMHAYVVISYTGFVTYSVNSYVIILCHFLCVSVLYYI